jgi:N-acetylneuraminic acid mutarotase
LNGRARVIVSADDNFEVSMAHPRNRLVRGFALSIAAFLLASSAGAQGTNQGMWAKAADMTAERTEVGVASLNGKIYVLGGGLPGLESAPLAQEYDPAKGSWRDLAPIPKATSHAGVAAMNGKVYVAGGFTANVHKNPIDLFAEYDVASNQWRALAPLSSPRGSVGLVAAGGNLHVIGGRGADGKTIATHEIYDPKTGKWASAAPLPVARDHLGIIAVDDKIYIVGGRTNATVDNVGLTDVYDPSTDKWRSLAPMPTPRSSGAIAYYRGLIVYHGGECKDASKRMTFDEYEGYDPQANRWLTLSKAPSGLHAHGAATVGNAAYFFGGTAGCGGDMPSKAVYAFKLP